MKAGKFNYSSERRDHFGVVRSYEIFAPKGEADHLWSHSGWEILWSGQENTRRKTTRIRGRDFSLDPSQFLFFNSREEHIEIYSQSQATEYSAVAFPDSTLSEIFEEIQLDPREVLFDTVDHTATKEFDRLLVNIFSLRDGSSTQQFSFECLTYELILKLLAACGSSASHKIKKLSAQGAFPSNVARVKKILAENLSREDFSLDDLAGQSGISKFHLIRTFKARTGLSPMQYLAQVRFDYAKSLLERGTPVGEAALRSGFGSFSTFRKTFQRMAGRPPSAFKI